MAHLTSQGQEKRGCDICQARPLYSSREHLISVALNMGQDVQEQSVWLGILDDSRRDAGGLMVIIQFVYQNVMRALARRWVDTLRTQSGLDGGKMLKVIMEGKRSRGRVCFLGRDVDILSWHLSWGSIPLVNVFYARLHPDERFLLACSSVFRSGVYNQIRRGIAPATRGEYTEDPR